MEPERKRSRSANFTAEEKIICLNIINKYKNIVECKKTDATTWREKECAWKKIESEFNSQSPAGICRTVDNLKKYFENQKKATRKVVANEKRSFFRTGGGSSSTSTVTSDPTFDLTMEIINKKSVCGLINHNDGDAAAPDCSESNISECELNTEQIIILPMDDVSILSCIYSFVNEINFPLNIF